MKLSMTKIPPPKWFTVWLAGVVYTDRVGYVGRGWGRKAGHRPRLVGGQKVSKGSTGEHCW